MSEVGQCWGNAPAESFFASLKKGLVHHEKYTSREEAKASIFEYTPFFGGDCVGLPEARFQAKERAFIIMQSLGNCKEALQSHHPLFLGKSNSTNTPRHQE
jgi:hypothetical protein